VASFAASTASGCICATGTGLKYAFIDLALADIERAVPVIRNVLRKLKTPERSWLLFLEPELADEWVGVWRPDSPGTSGSIGRSAGRPFTTSGAVTPYQSYSR
jgi:hypothetical protein